MLKVGTEIEEQSFPSLFFFLFLPFSSSFSFFSARYYRSTSTKFEPQWRAATRLPVVTVPTRHMLCFYVPVAIFTIYLDHSNLGFFTSLPPGPLTGRLDPAAPAAPPLAILSSSDRMSLKIAKSQPFFSAISSISWTDMAIAQEIYLIRFAGGGRLKRVAFSIQGHGYM